MHPVTLVGRAEEVRRATERLAARVPVLVTGEAGAGKTALLHAAAAGLGGPVFYGGGMPMLRSRPGLPIERALRRDLPTADAPALASLASSTVGAGTLVLDDLQWADDLTLEALPSLARRVRLAMAVRAGTAVPDVRARLGDAQLIELGPLTPSVASDLVLRHRPTLSHREASAIAERAGGNPLLLRELADAPNGTASLRLVLRERLAELSHEASGALLRLILLARPAEPWLVEPGLAEIVASGLAVAGDGTITLRHALMGETVLRDVDDEVRRRTHGQLAARVADPGEAARHHLEAGEREEARRRALEASELAARPFERAGNLGVAAMASDGPAADDLRLQAAAELREAGEHRLSVAAARAVEGIDPRTRARRSLALAQSLCDLGERDTLDAEIAVGLRLARGVDDELEGRLLLQRAQGKIEDWDPACLEDVLVARELMGGDDSESTWMLARARYVNGDLDPALELALDAHDRALGEGRAGRAVETMAGAASIEIASGRRALAEAYLARAETLAEEFGAGRRRAWVLSFRGHLQTWQFGDYGAALATHASALADPVALGTMLPRTMGNQAIVLADLGHDPQAIDLLARAAAAAATEDARAWVGWLHGEADWLAGRFRQAHDRLTTVRTLLTDGPLPAFAGASLCWMALEQATVPAHPPPRGDAADLAGFMLVEHATRTLLEQSDGARARALFLDAAAAFEGLSVRDGLRARWGAGEAARHSGDLSTARALLAELEADLADRGHAPLLARTRRSLRQAGLRSTAARGPRRGALTAREDEVLGLVAAGWTSAEIAARLAVSPATVESHVRSARRKLGSRTRATAVHVALLGTRDRDETPPLVLAAGPPQAAAAVAELRQAGWQPVEGWDVPVEEWRVEPHRLLCHGTVTSSATAEAALRAAVRGAGIVATLDRRAPFAPSFFESLRRLGGVSVRDDDAPLNPELRRVLTLVAEGASVAEIAASTHQSPRTVKRRLAAARAALGARTTAEALRLLATAG